MLKKRYIFVLNNRKENKKNELFSLGMHRTRTFGFGEFGFGFGFGFGLRVRVRVRVRSSEFGFGFGFGLEGSHFQFNKKREWN